MKVILIRIFSGGHAQRSAGARGQRATDVTEEDASSVPSCLNVPDASTRRGTVSRRVRGSTHSRSTGSGDPRCCEWIRVPGSSAPFLFGTFFYLILWIWTQPGRKCPGAASSDSPTSRERVSGVGGARAFILVNSARKRCFIVKLVRNVNFELQWTCDCLRIVCEEMDTCHPSLYFIFKISCF